MKKIKVTLFIGILCALSVLFYNCKKENVSPTPPVWSGSTFTDVRDGKIYKTTKIGNMEWMAENLDFKTASGSWFYDDSDLNGAKYGRLYTLEAAKLAVPDGWHVATDLEWKQLEIALGMSQTEADGVDFRGTNEGDKLKSLSGWPENGNGTNDIQFSALPGGFRSNSGGYLVMNWYCYFWTATEGDNSSAWVRSMTYNKTKILRHLSFKGDGYSVRCVKN